MTSAASSSVSHDRFTTAIQRHADELTPSERRLVSNVLDQPRLAALGTASALAREAEVHEATVSRLARKLGFDDFAAFRDALREQFIPSADTATRLQRTIDETGAQGLLGTLVAREIAGLSQLLAHVDDARVIEAARRLMGARRIHLFARGNAEVLARLMERRLRRFGREPQLLAGEGRDLAERALAFRPDDVLLLFAFRRQPRHYAPLVQAANEAGTGTIAITGLVGPLLQPAPDLLLSAPRSGDRGSYQTLTVPMAIANAVIIACATHGDTQPLRSLDRLAELIGRFD